MNAYTLPTEDAPDDVWCRRCDTPAVQVVGREAYCHEHALDALWKMSSPAWNADRHTVKKGHRS